MFCSETPLGQSLAAAGGGFHPELEFRQDAFGSSVYAATALPPGSAAVSCGFSHALTPAIARTNLGSSLPSTPAPTNHELITTYLALHRAFPTAQSTPEGLRLPHRAYVETLPTEGDLRTPAYYTEREMEHLRGTNLFGAVGDRTAGWKAEWEGVVSRLSEPARSGLSWELYLWAGTMMSSRAFSSSLIDGDKENNTPVLFPGVDTLNHKYGQKVTWSSDMATQTLSIVLEDGVPAGEQAFNTYGPKPNEELLLGYGFTTPNNPGDLLALKLSVPNNAPHYDLLVKLFPLREGETDPSSRFRHFVTRSGELPDALMAQMRIMLCDLEDPEAQDSWREVRDLARAGETWEAAEEGLRSSGGMGWQTEAEALDMLEQMLESKFEALIEGGARAREMADRCRAEVVADCERYRRGQIEILEKALEWRQKEFDVAMRAFEEGNDLDPHAEMVEDEEEADDEDAPSDLELMEQDEGELNEDELSDVRR